MSPTDVETPEVVLRRNIAEAEAAAKHWDEQASYSREAARQQQDRADAARESARLCRLGLDVLLTSRAVDDAEQEAADARD